MNEKNQKPITELNDEDDIVAAYKILKENALDESKEAIQLAERNHKIYKGTHFMQKSADGNWIPSQSSQSNRHIPRTQTNDLNETIDSLVPLHVRNKPDIQIMAEDAESPVDLREIDEETGELAGGYSEEGLTQAKSAEALTDIMNTEMEREGEQRLHSIIVLEALLNTAAYTTFKYTQSREKGVQISPKLLHRANVLPDPNGEESWDFGDYRYIVLREWLTPSEIKLAYGIDESDYTKNKKGGMISGGGLVGKVVGKVKDLGKPKSKMEEYGMRQYPIDSLYYNHVVPMVAKTGEGLKGDAPDPMQYIVINENKLAEKQVNPFWHGEFPATSFVANPLPGDGEGVSQFSNLYSSQLAIDLVQNAIIEIAMLMGNPAVIVDEDALPKKGVNFAPGGMTVLPKGSLARGKFQERAGNGRNVGAEQILQLLKQSIKESGGDESGILRGATPSSIKSGKHANIVLDSLLSRHSHVSAMFNVGWYRMYRQRVITLQQFADFNAPYWRRQTDVSGEYSRFGDAMRNLRWDLKIHSKADLPFSPSERIQQAVFLWMHGLCDIPYVYKTIDINAGAELEEIIKQQNQPQDFISGIPGPEQAVMRQQIRMAEMGQGQASLPAGNTETETEEELGGEVEDEFLV